MAEQDQPQQTPLEMELTLVDGVYCNRVFVTGSGFDFVFDFALATPGRQSFKIVSRVIMSPEHAQSLQEVLGRVLERFRQEIGEVPQVSIEDAERRRIGFQASEPADDNEEGTSDGEDEESN